MNNRWKRRFSLANSLLIPSTVLNKSFDPFFSVFYPLFTYYHTLAHSKSFWAGCVALPWYFTMLPFAFSSLNVWLTFQAKNNARSSPASTTLAQVLHKVHTTVPKIITHTVVEKWMEYKAEQRRALVELWCKVGVAAIGKKAWISGWNNIKQCKNQAYSLSSYGVLLVWYH